MPKEHSIINKIMLKNKIKQLKRQKVLKMLAVMESAQNPTTSNACKNEPNTDRSPTTPSEANGARTEDFLASGRTGRRNALPDILGQHANVTSSDLPSRLQALTTKDDVTHKVAEPTTSGTNDGGKS